MAFPSQLIRRFLNEAARQPGLTFAEWLQGRTTGVFLGASVAVTDCGGDTSRDPGQAAEGACTTGDCASERGDGIVNAEDGAFDCADDGCVEQSPCLDVPVHGVPYEADCGDGADEDGDGATDCNDTDCDADPAFVTGSLYRAPAGGGRGALPAATAPVPAAQRSAAPKLAPCRTGAAPSTGLAASFRAAARDPVRVGSDANAGRGVVEDRGREGETTGLAGTQHGRFHTATRRLGEAPIHGMLPV